MNRYRFEYRTGGAGAVIIVDGLVYSAKLAPLYVMRQFADKAPRSSLIGFARWNDRNSCVTDYDMRREYGRVATTDELRETVRGMLGEWANDGVRS
jgi:hypothetical protein